jgi:hypothetical protein
MLKGTQEVNSSCARQLYCKGPWEPFASRHLTLGKLEKKPGITW